MKNLTLLAIGVVAILAGCSSSVEEVKAPPEATEGGNVVNDPELKKQLMGDTGPATEGGGGGGGQSGGLGSN